MTLVKEKSVQGIIFSTTKQNQIYSILVGQVVSEISKDEDKSSHVKDSQPAKVVRYNKL